MKEIKLIKKKWERRRFIKGASFSVFENWFDEWEELKEKIKQHSSFQRIGSKSIVEANLKTRAFCVLAEVVGVPAPGFKLVDFPPHELYSLELPKGPFLTTIEDIYETAGEIGGNKTLALSDFFHIVLENDQIALHFFRQKDYIHSEH
jgi:hypothetical protein